MILLKIALALVSSIGTWNNLLSEAAKWRVCSPLIAFELVERSTREGPAT